MIGVCLLGILYNSPIASRVETIATENNTT